MATDVAPNRERVGQYTLFYELDTSIDELYVTLLRNCQITRVCTCCGEDVYSQICEVVKSLDHRIEVMAANREEFERLQSRIAVPNWLLSQDNYQRILAGGYQEMRPVTAEFVPTLNCCFRCVQCSYSEPKKAEGVWLSEGSERSQVRFAHDFDKRTTHMTEETMIVALDRLVEGGVRNILFTGGGEPFMNRAVTLGGMRYAKDRGRTVGLYTNGYLLNDQSIEEILGIEPLFVRVSVYGTSERTFENYTRTNGSGYWKVMQNIQKLAMKKLDTGSQTQLALSYLVHPYTMKDIELLADILLKCLGLEALRQIQFIRFTPAVDYFGGVQHPQEWMQAIFARIESEVKPKLSGTGVGIRPYGHRVLDLNRPKSYDVCRASGWYGEVGPSGDMYLCCEKLFMPEYRIGNLVEQSLGEIFDGALRNSVIGRVNGSHCKDCPPLCKPHELNKVCDEVEALRNSGEIYLLSQWRNDLLQCGLKPAYFAGKLNAFES